MFGAVTSTTFTAGAVYRAVITLTPNTGFTLEGVTGDFFTVVGATVTRDGNTVYAVFPVTATPVPAPEAVTITEIAGVTPPVTGETPALTITPTAQFTGTVEWAPAPGAGGFSADTMYTATITLTILPGFTLEGVTGVFFDVAGATTVSRANNVVTAVFPETAP
jgi:hypothetical protein